MALEAFASNDLSTVFIYDNISATPFSSHEHESPETSFLMENGLNVKPQDPDGASSSRSLVIQKRVSGGPEAMGRRQNLRGQGRKKRKRKPRVCKNKDEAEMQRMTHIVVERNRRKQMNEHLSVLRSLMPLSYVQRGDQASIVGGAIEFVKELEQLWQSLEARKFQLVQRKLGIVETCEEVSSDHDQNTHPNLIKTPTFSEFFWYPQCTNWSQAQTSPNKYKYMSKTKAVAGLAEIVVTLMETHANLRILWRQTPRQLSKLVAGFQTLHLTILHLNVTTIHPFVLHSISAKVEEGCQLNSVDDITMAVQELLRIIILQEEALLCR